MALTPPPVSSYVNYSSVNVTEQYSIRAHLLIESCMGLVVELKMQKLDGEMPKMMCLGTIMEIG